MARPPSSTTRRRFLQAAGVSAAALASGCEIPLGRSGDGDELPNVVVIVIDALRADHTFGDLASTPYMDALARQGVSFTRSYPEAMPTSPARNSVLSGRRGFPFRGWHHYEGLIESPGWQPLGSVKDTYTSVLRRAGYWSAMASDNPFVGFSPQYKPYRRSFDHIATRGGQVGGREGPVPASAMRKWVPPALDDVKTRLRIQKYLANGLYSPNEKGSFAERVFRDAIQAVEVAPRDRPLSLLIDSFEPHEPWTPPRKYIDMYGDPDYQGPEPAMARYRPVETYMSDPEAEVLIPRMKALYAAEVTETDYWLGAFLDRLHDLSLERDTMFVLVGDHGVFLGEHGYTGKSSERLHPELVHVPMIVVDPKRRRAGTSTGYYATTSDIAPTVLSMAGVEAPGGMNGADLSPLFSGDQPPRRDYAYGGYKNSFFLRTERWAMSGLNQPAEFQLYDLRDDPGELRSVAATQPRKARQLYEIVRREAGGDLPYYTGLPW